jgi:hypothetical protein
MRASTLLSWVALWALGFVRASVLARTGGCGSGSSLTKSALLQAVKNGHLATWHGLTEQATNKHLKMTPSNAMGHMNEWIQNIRSTSKVSITSDIEDETVTPEGLGPKTHVVYAMVINQ